MSELLNTSVLAWRADAEEIESIEIGGPDDTGLSLSLYLDPEERTVLGVLAYEAGATVPVVAAGYVPARLLMEFAQ